MPDIAPDEPVPSAATTPGPSSPASSAVVPDGENTKGLEKLTAYRDGLKDGISDGEKDYQTTITYLAVGALAFFLTINEKFFHLTTTRYQCLLWLSLGALLLTLFLLLVCTILDIRGNEAIRDLADKMLDNKAYNKDELTREWAKWMQRTRLWYYTRFALLLGGITMEVLFVCLNLQIGTDQPKSENISAITIEIQGTSNSMHIKVDTSNKRTILTFTH
jgi:hypothetical protein